jgi:[ribosomal protein S5]-alanine N-acetyltransferase
VPRLLTPRLELVPITLEAIEAVIAGDKARAEQAVGAAFPAEWPNQDLIARAFPVSIDAIRADPATRLWGDTLVLQRGERRVVGSVVFHGKPVDGVAEVGYGIEEGSRGQGLAVEATNACVAWALEQDGIVAVQATTFPWHAASLGVIRRLGMTQVATREHPVLGDLLVFERRRG